MLFHLGVLDHPATPVTKLVPLPERMADVSEPLRASFVAYLRRKGATCKPKTVSSLATRLAGFGRFLNETDPTLESLADLDRCRHIEPFLTSLTTLANSVTGAPITVADQARRVNAAANFLAEITEWGWPDAPGRRLFFRTDNPRLPRPLPRYIPVDADRRLGQELAQSSYRLAADALLLQRACGLRIGELLDLEIDCVHEVPGQGSWLKVPLGKLDTERMVPLDEETLDLLDRVVRTRSGGRPVRHPRTGRPAEFLFTHHGQRLSQNAVREELDRAAARAGIGHVNSHQLRHTYATALVNAGVSLQALMALLGHSSAEMSLRYGRLFDATVRQEYERALDLAKSQIGPIPTGRRSLPLADITNGADWKDTPTIKSRMAGGYCLRAPAQGSCPYANICEHCPSFRTDASHLQVLAAQRVDAAALAADAEARGWIIRGRTASAPARPAGRAHRADSVFMTPLVDQVELACSKLVTTDRPVTFSAVADITGLSRATLYRNENLRADHRRTPRPATRRTNPDRPQHRDRPPTDSRRSPRRHSQTPRRTPPPDRPKIELNSDPDRTSPSPD